MKVGKGLGLRSKVLEVTRRQAEQHAEPERRAEARLCGPFPALALDVSACGKKLGTYTVLENFSADGFYMLLERPAEPGEYIVVITQISQAIVMLQGAVVRVEEQKDGIYGLGVAVKRHQIFSLKKIAA